MYVYITFEYLYSVYLHFHSLYYCYMQSLILERKEHCATPYNTS
jgi:hypothetical protein